MPVTTLIENTQTDLDDKRIVALRAKCELYTTFEDNWKFYLSAYEGGPDFLTQDNLFRHFRESETDYLDRCKRAHNMNYCEPLVDFFTNFIFSEAIDRNGGSEVPFYNDFILDVNKKGDNIDEFMRQVSDDSQIFGMSYIMVDSPKFSKDEVVTKSDEVLKGIRPYFVLIKPEEIIDWIVDDFGVLSYIKRRQYDRQVIGGEMLKIEKYAEWYPDRVEESVVDVTDLQKIKILSYKVPFDNVLGKIPLVVSRHKKSKKYPFMGLSFLRDFAGNNREIFNLTSLLQEFLYRQAFNILTMEQDSSVNLKDAQDGVIGTANSINYPKGGKPPQYITPPSDPAKFIQSECSRIKNEMFTRAAQDALNELFNGEGASGFSQAQSFSKTVPFISSRADMLEQTEVRLMSLVMEWMGKAWDGKIKYKDRYELTNLTDALTQFQILVKDLQVPSKTFVKAELKRLVHEYDSKLPIELVAQIDKDIDGMNFTEWMSVQEEALVGVAPGGGTSPGEQQQPKSTGTMSEVQAESGGKNAATTKLKNK